MHIQLAKLLTDLRRQQEFMDNVMASLQRTKREQDETMGKLDKMMRRGK